KLVYALSHMTIRVRQEGAYGPVEIRIYGAASFVRLPQLVDALENAPRDREVHVRFDGLEYIDHAGMEAIATWERKRTESSAPTVVEWDGLHAKYRERNQFPKRAQSVAVEQAAS